MGFVINTNEKYVALSEKEQKKHILVHAKDDATVFNNRSSAESFAKEFLSNQFCKVEIKRNCSPRR